MPTSNKKVSSNGKYGAERDHDLPWNDKKVAVFKALKQLKAVGATNAVGVAKVAEKAGVTARDVRHYCYHGKAGGLVDLAKVEGERGYGFYLTNKGASTDPAKAMKEQQAAKASSK